MPALDDAGSPPPVLSERARGKQRAVSPRSPSLSEAPRPDAHSADTPTSPRKRSRSASSSSGQRKRARSVIDLDASSEGDGEAVDDDVVDAARDGELDDLLDELDPEALHAVLERTTANATSGSRVGSDVGDPIELSDDSDDEPVVVRPPAAPVPAAPAPVAPSSDHASGPQPFASLTCPICLGAPAPLVVTICGHAFCGPCIYSTLTQSENQLCPVCRGDLSAGFGRALRGASFAFAVPKPASTSRA